MTDFTILLDMDSTVYDLLTPTLEYVNNRYEIDLTPRDIKTWRWDKVYDVDPAVFWNHKGTYKNLKPYPDAIEAIRQIHELGIRQVFLSAGNFKYATEKFGAIDRDFPFIGSKEVLLTGGNKDLVIGDVLVDDGPHNLAAFQSWGKFAVLAKMSAAPYCIYPKADAIITNWYQYPYVINSLMNQGWVENVG